MENYSKTLSGLEEYKLIKNKEPYRRSISPGFQRTGLDAQFVQNSEPEHTESVDVPKIEKVLPR